MRTLTALLLSLFIHHSLYGQTPGTQWQISDQRQQLYAFFPTADSGALALGSSLLKIDMDGLIQWQSTSFGFSGISKIIPSADGAYFVASHMPQAIPRLTDWAIAKFASDGKILFKKSLGGSVIDEFFDVLATPDGGCILTGNTTSNDGTVIPPSGVAYNGKADCWVVKIDHTGAIEWQKRFGSTGNDNARRIISDGSGGFLVGCEVQANDGDFTSPQSQSTWILHLDSNGSLLWKKQYGASFFREIKRTANGNFLLLADTQYGSDFRGYVDIWMAMVDLQGNLLWERWYGGTQQEYSDVASIQEDQSGNIYLGVSTYSRNVDITKAYGGRDAWLLKVNNRGELLWQTTIGGSGDETAMLKLQKNNELLVCINSNSTDGHFADGFTTPLSTTFDTWVFCLDGQGNTLWRQLYGGYRNDWAELTFSPDHHFFLAGASQSFLRSGPAVANSLWITKAAPANLVKAKIFLDANGNGIKDSTEKLTQDAQIVAEKNGHSVTAKALPDGTFTMGIDTGLYTVRLVSVPDHYTPPATNPVVGSFSYFKSDSVSIALRPIPNRRDLKITMTALTPARPGFPAQYQLLYKNTGTVLIGEVDLVLIKDSRAIFASALPSPVTVTVDTLRWNYSLLGPGDTASILVNIELPAPPTVNIGDTLVYLATIAPVLNDQKPTDNSSHLRQEVAGSYDPNDKAENNGGQIPYAFITSGNYLQYTIRFQNTGTDTAFTVTIRDTLSHLLDASTLQMVAASHPYSLTKRNGVHLSWKFDNILLPDSNRNEPASHGYIVYRIRPKSHITMGETIHNTASIYFDFNPPIVTNDAATQVAANFVVLPQALLSLHGQLHNSKVNLQWKVATGAGIERFEVERGTNGRDFVRVGAVGANLGEKDYYFTDDIAGQAAGTFLYRLKLLQPNGSYRLSPQLLFRKDDLPGNSLTVYPNPTTGPRYVAFTGTYSGKARLQLLNASGILIGSQIVQVQSGKNVYELAGAASLRPGIYAVQLVFNNGVQNVLFAVQ